MLCLLMSTALPEQKTGMMSIIIRRPYGHLEKELKGTFEGEKDVQVIVDRRYRERRTRQQPVETDRRQADRRRQKEVLLDVVIPV